MLAIPLLETTAEVSIALAGFVAVFLALSSRTVFSGVVLAVSLAIGIKELAFIRRWPLEERKPDSTTTVVIGWVCGIIALVCHTLNLVAWPWEPSAGLYLLGVWCVILIAALYFVSLIFSRVT